MAAPAGPQSCVPVELFWYGLAGSGRGKVFQICLPLAPSSATRLPRNLQHSYAGDMAEAPSTEDDRTNKPASSKTGAPATLDAGGSSTFAFQPRCLSVA